MELSDKKKEKLLNAVKEGKIKDETTLAVFEMVTDMQEKMDEMKQELDKAVKDVKDSEVSLDKVLESVKGNDGHTPTDEELLALISNVMPEPIPGHTPTKEELVSLIKPLVPKIKDGHTPTTEELYNLIMSVMPDHSKMAKDITENVKRDVEIKIKEATPKIEDIENDIPKLGNQIRDALELITEEEEKLKIEAIGGLRKELDGLKKVRNEVPNGGIAGRDLFKDIDISVQLDGVTKTFNLPAIWNIISVDLSSFPYGSCRKNVDFTYTPTSITFTDTIDAPTQLAEGQSCILTVITG